MKMSVSNFLEEMRSKNLAFEASISGGMWREKPRWVKVPSEIIAELPTVSSDEILLTKSLDIGGVLRLTDYWHGKPKGSKLVEYATRPTKVKDLFLSRQVFKKLLIRIQKENITISADFRLVNWYGKKYRLTPQESLFLHETLLEIKETGLFELPLQTIANRSSEKGIRFNDLFKNNKSFKKVFFKRIKRRKGFYKINLPFDFLHKNPI